MWNSGTLERRFEQPEFPISEVSPAKHANGHEWKKSANRRVRTKTERCTEDEIGDHSDVVGSTWTAVARPRLRSARLDAPLPRPARSLIGWLSHIQKLHGLLYMAAKTRKRLKNHEGNIRFIFAPSEPFCGHSFV
jgi:hypothetical protein